MSRPVLRVSRPTFQANMNWTASPSTAWTEDQIDAILNEAWEALDIDGLDIDGLDIEVTGDVAPRSAWVIDGDDGEIDAALLRRWDAAVEDAAGGAA